MTKIILRLGLSALLLCLLTLAVSASDGAAAGDDTLLIAIVTGVAVGLAAAGIALFFMVRSMNTVRKQKNADTYVADGSFRLTENRDVFLYSRVSRVRVNTSNKRN